MELFCVVLTAIAALAAANAPLAYMLAPTRLISAVLAATKAPLACISATLAVERAYVSVGFILFAAAKAALA